MQGDRCLRVAQVVRGEVAKIIRDELRHPKVRDVVITQVTVTRDIGIARIYFNSYANCNLNEVCAALTKSSPFIRRVMGKNLNMKKIPSLEFYVDKTPENADKIDHLLKDIR